MLGGLETRADPRSDGVRELLDVTLMFDHDAVDGAPAARFAAELRKLVESAELLMAEPADRGNLGSP